METKKRPVGRPRKYKPGEHPNSVAAREKTQFAKGHSGNPTGRKLKNPKTPTMDSIVAGVGNEKETIKVNGKEVKVTKFEKLIRVLFKNAFEGKPTAQKELVERIWGKTPDALNLNITERKEFKGGDPEKYVANILDRKAKA